MSTINQLCPRCQEPMTSCPIVLTHKEQAIGTFDGYTCPNEHKFFDPDVAATIEERKWQAENGNLERPEPKIPVDP